MKRINSNFCLFLIILTNILIFVPMGMNVTALNSLTPALEVFINSTFVARYDVEASADDVIMIITLAQTMLVAGATIGSVSAHLWLRFMSRKLVMVAINVVALVSSILMGPVAFFSGSYEILIIGRLLNGLARGVAMTVAPLYIAEVTSRETLAFHQTPFACLYQLSSALANAVGLPRALGGVNSWPYALALPGVFSLVYLLCVPWIPHTLTWTIQEERKRIKHSTQASSPADRASFSLLKRLRYEQGDSILTEFRSIQNEIDADAQVERTSIRKLWSIGKYRRQLIAVVFIQLCPQLCAAQAILLYTNTMFEGAGVKPEDSTYYTIGLFLLMAVVCATSSGCRQKLGSRTMFHSGLSIVVIGLILLTVSTVLSDSVSEMAYVSVAGLMITSIGLSAGPMLLFTAYPSEITTQVTRPNALWLGTLTFWITGTIVSFVFPYSQRAIGGYAYIPFVILVVIEIIYTRIFVPDTHKRSVANIQRFFEKSEISTIHTIKKNLSFSKKKPSIHQISSSCDTASSTVSKVTMMD